MSTVPDRVKGQGKNRSTVGKGLVNKKNYME